MPTLLTHKRARHDYEILETFEAGLELLGGEVKSLRGGKGNLLGSHVILRGGEAYVVGMQVPEYQPKNSPEGYDPMRTRRLLLSRTELSEIESLAKRKGNTLVPLSVYTKGPRIKLELALVRGKKLYDKRETIKKREFERSIHRDTKYA